MAVEHPLITATCVEASECPDLVRQYRVTGVPKTVISTNGGAAPSPNGGTLGTGEPAGEILGALPEAEFVRQAVQAVTPGRNPGP